MAHSKAIAVLFVIPSMFWASTAYAASLTAGFAPGPVWISHSAPASGSTVRIYTVVYDGSDTALEGSVSFLIDGAVVGSTPFSLNPGESAIESVSWTATEGSHTVQAKITSAVDKKSKIATEISLATTSTLSIVVGPAAPKAAAAEALDTAQSAVVSSTPIVAQAIEQTKTATESIRKAGEAALVSLAGISTTSTTSAQSGSVLGAEIEVAEEPTATPPEATLVQKVARVLLPLFQYPALFYPVFLGVLLFALWLLARRLRSPNSRKR